MVALCKTIDKRLVGRKKDKCRSCGRRGIRRTIPKDKVLYHEGHAFRVRRIAWCPSCAWTMIVLHRHAEDDRFAIHLTEPAKRPLW